MIAETPTLVRQFELRKRTGTHADALAAFGLQHLLSLLSGAGYDLVDEGSSYVVKPPGASPLDLDSLDYEGVRRSGGYRYLRLPKDDSPPVADEIVYAQQRQRLLEWREANRKNAKLPRDQREQLDALKPMPNWMLYQNVNVLQGFGSYAKLHESIRSSEPGQFAQQVHAQLEALATGAPTGLPFAPGQQVSAVQALNPIVGKGVSGAKPKGTGLAGLPGYFVDGFEEWLRYVGLDRAATSIALDDDIKIFVMAPRYLDARSLETVCSLFSSLEGAYSPAKSDVMGAIRLAREMVRSSEFLQPAGARVVRFQNRRPNQIIAGLHVAYFKSLGQARALTNISFIGLPGWFPVERETADIWLRVLEEHERTLQPLREDRTEEAALLVRYRDFLTAGPELVPALLEFLGGHAVHVMRSRVRGQYAPPFTLPVLSEFLRRLFVNQDQSKDLAPILESEGFKNVARAIRLSTVTEMFHHSRSQQEYDIRYGLLQDLKRKARFKDQFVSELSDFVTNYNYENRRKQEQRGGASYRRRPQVTTSDLADVVRLLDAYPSETVAMLLLAYAAASDPRSADDQAARAPATTA